MSNNPRYAVSAGDNSTDLGCVGHSATRIGARTLGRKHVDACLPGGCGSYTVRDHDGQTVERGERTLQTGYRWRTYE